MIRYLIRRVLWAVVLFIAVTFVTYVIFFLVPAHPERAVAGRNAGPEDIARAAHFIGVDQPVYVQYGKFLKRLVVEQSLGFSFATRQQENDIIAAAAPVTASLVIGGAILWLCISLPIGILAALRPRSLLDRSSTALVLIGISAHPVFIGLIFSYFFGYKLGWFPITGYCDFINPSTNCGGPVDWFYHLVLPWVTFAILFAAYYVRFIRSSVLDTVNEDYVRTARAKGAPERTVIAKHVLRNAMLPIVTILGLDVAVALGGAIFTESVYGLPGLGLITRQSLNSFDLPTIQAVVVFTTLVIIVVSLAVDLLYAVIDPRIRLT
jgi:peptide/nickel transport system permease protein